MDDANDVPVSETYLKTSLFLLYSFIKFKWNLDLNYIKTKKLLPVDVSIGMAETIPKQTKFVIWIDRCKKEFII